MQPIKKPIQEIAATPGISNDHLLPYGHDKAKVPGSFINSFSIKKDSDLILVNAISLTPAGEGKTTTTVGSDDDLNAVGKNCDMYLRGVVGAVFWDERKCCGWRIRAGHPDGRDELTFHR